MNWQIEDIDRSTRLSSQLTTFLSTFDWQQDHCWSKTLHLKTVSTLLTISTSKPVEFPLSRTSLKLKSTPTTVQKIWSSPRSSGHTTLSALFIRIIWNSTAIMSLSIRPFWVFSLPGILQQSSSHGNSPWSTRRWSTRNSSLSWIQNGQVLTLSSIKQSLVIRAVWSTWSHRKFFGTNLSKCWLLSLQMKKQLSLKARRSTSSIQSVSGSRLLVIRAKLSKRATQSLAYRQPRMTSASHFPLNETLHLTAPPSTSSTHSSASTSTSSWPTQRITSATHQKWWSSPTTQKQIRLYRLVTSLHPRWTSTSPCQNLSRRSFLSSKI